MSDDGDEDFVLRHGDVAEQIEQAQKEEEKKFPDTASKLPRQVQSAAYTLKLGAKHDVFDILEQDG